ncbi:uricase-like [Lingula anatina]|uniref:Uricase n=1 Tax=Lingula anatina TaxID=7574 RepID=A0A1S3HEX0_LINAN|nr:uricase-like [Lingula anatina]|eukprot:XP_013384613.1 uricase-like [Lingula anatina]
MLSDHEVQIADSDYGKNYVKLLKVRREGRVHHVQELEINTALTLSSKKDYLRGDNTDVIATDSQKNTCYILAKQNGIDTIEVFAQILANHFLTKYPWVVKANIHIEQAPWKRIQQGGREHVHAFISSPECIRFCDVIQEKHGVPKVSAGLKGMKILKTTASSFVNFVDDEYRILPDMNDRIFCTVVQAKWDYSTTEGLAYCNSWSAVKSAILDKFAGPPDQGLFSPSVQHTLYLAQKQALSKVPQISRIELVLPNVHAYKFDFSKFTKLGITDNNEIFQPADKPSGNIRAVLERNVKSRL